jgi:hypothetical protein
VCTRVCATPSLTTRRFLNLSLSVRLSLPTDGKLDLMCYAYDEWTRIFVPLSLNSQIKFVKRQSLNALSTPLLLG